MNKQSLTKDDYRTITGFDAHGKKSFLKTLWGKEKMLVTSIFSFPPQCFLAHERQIYVLLAFDILYANIQFGQG